MPATASLLTRSVQGEALSAASDRLANTILLNEGVVDVAGNSFQVLQDTGANMQVKVGSGTAYDKAVVAGDLAGMGVFIAEHQNATQTLVIAASDPTNPRKDIVILQMYEDGFDSSTNDYADLEVITGTPAGSPSEPAVPASAIKLATVDVAAAATAVVNVNITDARTSAGLSTSMATGRLTRHLSVQAADNLSPITSPGTEEAIDTQTVASDVTWPVIVMATVTGFLDNTAAAARLANKTRLEVSIDGGSTWTAGVSAALAPLMDLATTGSAGDRLAVSDTMVLSGTPTAAIQVRTVAIQGTGTISDVKWRGLHYAVLVVPDL
jgi:hypothetical protein